MNTRVRPHSSPIQVSEPRIIDVGSSLQPAAHSARPSAPASASPPLFKRWVAAVILLGTGIGGLAKLGVQAWSQGEELAPIVVSGKAGLKQASSGRFQRWRKQHVEVQIDSSVEQLGSGARSAIQAAFSSWHSAGITLPDVTFGSTSGTQVSSSPDGVSSIVYAPITIAGHGNDLAVTIAFSDPTSGEIVEADVIINAKHDFATLDAVSEGSDDEEDEGSYELITRASASRCVTHSDGARCGRKYDVQNVMTHEAGHFFGLAEDTGVTSATMYECISACETHKRVLGADDELAVTELYADGFEEAQPEPAGCSGAHVTPSTHAGISGLAVSGLALFGLAWMRRRKF